MAVFLYVLTAILLLLVLLILLSWRGATSEKQVIRERFSGGMTALSSGSRMKRMAEAAGNIGAVEAMRRRTGSDEEVAVMLSQAGVHSKAARSLYYTVSVLTPFMLVGLFLLTHALMSPGFKNPLLLAIMVAIAGVLLPKRILSYVAEKRRQEMSQELPVFVQTLRILFDSGLAVEQALRVICAEARMVFPHVAMELDRALQRAATGLDLADELGHVAEGLHVDEFTDTVSILRQMIRQGGSARTSLLNLQKMIEDRQLTALQEKVAKLSAKMAIVMILFLFPALFILLAAPGFMALTRALVGLS